MCVCAFADALQAWHSRAIFAVCNCSENSASAPSSVQSPLACGPVRCACGLLMLCDTHTASPHSLSLLLNGQGWTATRRLVCDVALGQTFAKVFPKFAVWSRKAESRTKVAVSSWWVLGTFIRPRSGRRDS